MRFVFRFCRLVLACGAVAAILQSCANGPTCSGGLCGIIKEVTGGSSKPTAATPPPRPQPPPALTASCASVKTAESVAPTLLEPFDRPPSGWYVDTLDQGAQMSMINVAAIQSTRGRKMTYGEMATLRRQRPDLYALLNLAYMPNLPDVALMGRIARVSRSKGLDSDSLLSDVESKGHALSRAMGRSPADAKFIEERVQDQRENLNGVAARAAVGDAASVAELSSLADQVGRTEVGAAALAATTAYATALHCMRVRSMVDDGSFNAFWLLKTPSFETALQRVSQVEVMTKLPAAWIKDAAGGGFDDNVMKPRAKAGCFPLEASGWESAEIRTWGQFCGADAQPAVAKAGICNSPDAFRTMGSLATAALLTDPNLQTMRGIVGAGRGQPLVGITIKGVDAIDGRRLSDGLHCTAAGQPIFRDGETRAGTGPLKVASVPMEFIVRPVDAGHANFSLILLMGSKPFLPFAATAAVSK